MTATRRAVSLSIALAMLAAALLVLPTPAEAIIHEKIAAAGNGGDEVVPPRTSE